MSYHEPFTEPLTIRYPETIVHHLRHLNCTSHPARLTSLMLPSLQCLRFSMPAAISALASFAQSAGNTITQLHIEYVSAKHLEILYQFAATPDLTIDYIYDAEPDDVFVASRLYRQQRTPPRSFHCSGG
ncbi:hypothetical protein C8J57DRAFT_1494903 [Mycena rebaudengoi]|nr:hypothetical protein C8J57DRAFT_1494903 [Mycena rebaudengoi]